MLRSMKEKYQANTSGAQTTFQAHVDRMRNPTTSPERGKAKEQSSI